MKLHEMKPNEGARDVRKRVAVVLLQVLVKLLVVVKKAKKLVVKYV